MVSSWVMWIKLIPDQKTASGDGAAATAEAAKFMGLSSSSSRGVAGWIVGAVGRGLLYNKLFFET